MAVKLKNNVDRVMRSMEIHFEKRLKIIASHLKDYFYEALSHEGSGNFYINPKTGLLYQASAPGEYPALRTGDLRESMKYRVVPNKSGPFLVLGTDLDYGPPLETYMKRSFVRRAMIENLEDIHYFLTNPYA